MFKIFLLIPLLCSLPAAAQKTGRQLADSLLQALPSAKDDTIKAKLYNRIFNELTNQQPDEALQIARTGLSLTKKMAWSKGIGTFQNNIGRYHSNMGNYDSAVMYYNASIAAQQKANNKQGIAVCYNNLGVAAQNIKADYTTAADYYFKALAVLEELKDSSQLANTLNNIATIYMLQKDYNKALEFSRKALRLREQKGDINEIAVCLQSIGKIYLLLKDTAKAKEHFQKGLSVSESIEDLQGMAAAWSNLPLTWPTDYRAVTEARIKAKQLWDKINPAHPEALVNLGNLGIIYLDIARYDSLHKVKYDELIPDDKVLLLNKASGYLKAAIQLAEQTGDIDNHSFFTGALAEVQEQQGDFKNAYYNYKFFKESEDSIYSQESKNKIAAAESRRELELNQLALSDQRKTMWALVAGIMLISVIGFLLYRQAVARKRTNRQLMSLNKELDQANQSKARFFALMSHDLRSPVSRLINFLHLQKNDPELLTPELKEVHDQKITEGAEALLDNMETMLLWSKSQMEQFKPANKQVDINELFTKLKRSFTNNNIQYSFSNTVTHLLNSDDNYLFSILHNLLQNAGEALRNTPGATVECSATMLHNEVVFTVKDNGPGYPEAMLENDPAHHTFTSGKKGLGLFMIHDMATAINGKIRLSNTSNGALATLTVQAKS